MKRWLAILAGAAGLGLVGWAVFGGPSDEEQIRELIERLESAIEVDGQENPVGRMARLNGAFKEIFTKDVQVSIPELTSLQGGRRELADVATRASGYFEGGDVEIGIDELTIDGSKQGAHARTTATLTGTKAGGSGPERDTRKVTFRFTRDDGDWRIYALSVSGRGVR